MSEDDEREITYLDPNRMSEEQWVELKKIAVHLYDSGMHGRDQFKIAVHAFLQYMAINDFSVIIEDTPSKKTDMH